MSTKPFLTPEANALFQLALATEKRMDKMQKAFSKQKDMTEKDLEMFLKRKKLVLQLIEKNKEAMNVIFKDTFKNTL